MGPGWTVAAAVLATVTLGFVTEAAPHRPGIRDRSVPVLFARSATFAGLFACWFCLSWRPAFAATATLITLGVLRLVSARKRSLVGEPLVFSDFALLRQVIHHPDLYYVDARMLLPGVALAGLIASWMWIEPTILPSGHAAAAMAVLGLLLSLLSIGACHRLLASSADRLATPIGREPAALMQALTLDEARLGLGLSLVVRWILWRACLSRPVPMPVAGGEAALATRPHTVIVVQLESLIDPKAMPGGFSAPNLARMRKNALLQGRLGVPGHGAYTMRSEFAVLSGLEAHEIREEGFDPYLSAARRGFSTLAAALGHRGFQTIFVHPFRRTFFGRDRVMPALGFTQCVMDDAFAGAERIGGNVADAAVAARILDEVDRASAPVLVFAVTMQNHGPWRVELDPPVGSPLERYRRHLDDADRMVGMLLDGLERRAAPALLCIYGDHPPILDAVGAPTTTPSTIYVVTETGGSPASRQQDLSAAALGRLIRAWVAA